MSKITDIQDELRSVVQTILPSHRKLDNPIIIEDNNQLLLNQGFGVAVGGAINTNRLVGCQKSTQRDFTITITRCVDGISNEPTFREDAEKALLEDHYLLICEVYKNPTLNNTAAKMDFLGDNGIEQVFDIELQTYFLMMQINIQVEYFENIT